ncbi:TetR-like C-terminal domain-containing protein [Streptomyces sp. NPDC058457]|uniref:TetR-like C-terminal domain-containing protein n=1 Tax=Streptomyces sp. NPDC058457 TaxID=3346507 RepID=UPI00365ECB4D
MYIAERLAAALPRAARDGVPQLLALPDTGSVEEDLRQVLRGLCRLLSTSQGLTLLRIAVLPDDPERSDARQAYCVKRLARIEVLIRRGVDRGELRTDTDPDWRWNCWSARYRPRS